MNSCTSSVPFASSRRLVRAVGFVALLGFVGPWLFAQTPPPRGDGERRRAGGTQDDAAGGRRATLSSQDMQARMLTALRDRFGVTDDAEWAVISERLGKLMEVRRTAGGAPGAGTFGRGGPGGPGGPGSAGGEAGRGTRVFGGARTPEAEALQAAVTDKLPEAEIKARLAKVRETRKANEKKLEQAQEDFRAVLSVRQEAAAVLMGLLP